MATTLLDIRAISSDVNMEEMLNSIKRIDLDELSWSEHKVHDVGFGVQSIQIMATVQELLIAELLERVLEIDGVYSADILASYRTSQ